LIRITTGLRKSTKKCTPVPSPEFIEGSRKKDEERKKGRNKKA